MDHKKSMLLQIIKLANSPSELEQLTDYDLLVDLLKPLQKLLDERYDELGELYAPLDKAVEKIYRRAEKIYHDEVARGLRDDPAVLANMREVDRDRMQRQGACLI